MALPKHSIIINTVANQVLKPNGLKRKGQSRTWLDDNGWFTTIVEFQPFKDRKGTCVNVGVNLHWYPEDSWSFDIGYRESDFVDFNNEDQFTLDVNKLAQLALEKVMHYRKVLANFNTAKPTIEAYVFTSERLWGNYHKGTICGLVGDSIGLTKYYDQLSAVNHDVPWANKLKTRVSELRKISSDTYSFRQRISEIIKDTRKLKKLKELDIEIK